MSSNKGSSKNNSKSSNSNTGRHRDSHGATGSGNDNNSNAAGRLSERGGQSSNSIDRSRLTVPGNAGRTSTANRSQTPAGLSTASTAVAMSREGSASGSVSSGYASSGSTADTIPLERTHEVYRDRDRDNGHPHTRNRPRTGTRESGPQDNNGRVDEWLSAGGVSRGRRTGPPSVDSQSQSAPSSSEPEEGFWSARPHPSSNTDYD